MDMTNNKTKPTKEQIEKLLPKYNVGGACVDADVVVAIYDMESKALQDGFIGWREIADRLHLEEGIDYNTHPCLASYIGLLAELGWTIYSYPVVIPSKREQAERILAQYNATAKGTKYESDCYTLSEEDGLLLVSDDNCAEGPKKKGMFGASTYKQLCKLHQDLMECCDFAMRPPLF